MHGRYTPMAWRGRGRGLLFHWYVDLAVTLVVVSIIAHLIPYTRLGVALLSAEADSIMRLLGVAGYRTLKIGASSFIVLGSRVLTVRIVPLCSSLYGLLTFAASALLLPGLPLRARMQAALYMLLYYAVNITRILAGILIGLRWGLRAFSIYHNYFSILIILVSFAALWTHWFYTSLRGWER
jgi:exosortase/archaeosortase family protein